VDEALARGVRFQQGNFAAEEKYPFETLGGAAHNWVLGTRSNRDGIGARVRLVLPSGRTLHERVTTYQLSLAYQRSGSAEKAREHREIYARLIQEEKSRSLGVRGAQE
jgi:hypothetical protein